MFFKTRNAHAFVYEYSDNCQAAFATMSFLRGIYSSGGDFFSPKLGITFSTKRTISVLRMAVVS